MDMRHGTLWRKYMGGMEGEGQVEQYSNCKYPSAFHNSRFVHLLQFWRRR